MKLGPARGSSDDCRGWTSALGTSSLGNIGLGTSSLGNVALWCIVRWSSSLCSWTTDDVMIGVTVDAVEMLGTTLDKIGCERGLKGCYCNYFPLTVGTRLTGRYSQGVTRFNTGGLNTQHPNTEHIQNLNILKVHSGMVLFSNGRPTCTCLCTRLAIQKPNQYIVIKDGSHFGLFSNGPLFGFRLAFKYGTIQHLNYFWPSKIWTCLVFEPPLYWTRIQMPLKHRTIRQPDKLLPFEYWTGLKEIIVKWEHFYLG